MRQLSARQLLARPPPALALPAVRTYSRSSRSSLADDSGGWYGQQLRATTILSVRKDDKVVRGAPHALGGGNLRPSLAQTHTPAPVASGVSF